MTPMQKMTQLASQMSVKDLKDQAAKMFVCPESYASDVFNSILNALEKKLGEQEFIRFCDAM